MISTRLTTPLAAILADGASVPLIIGREAATELGLAVLEHLEGTPSAAEIGNLVTYAARHDESSPARDALVGVLLDGSSTLAPQVARVAREAIMRADWGRGRESAALNQDPQVHAVPRRQALSERLVAERARRIRPRVLAMVTEVITKGDAACPVPTCFVPRSRADLRDLLVQRVKIEPGLRAVITRWLVAQPPATRAFMAPIEAALVDVTTHAILHAPETAPLAPYLGDDVVAERVRTAVNYRGAPARARLATYLQRLPSGTPWYGTIHAIVMPPAPAAAG